MQTRLDERFSLHPLTQDERATCESMLGQVCSEHFCVLVWPNGMWQDPSCRVMLMPTHHINEMGDMMGFRFWCNASAPGNCLPVVRTMFHGHTLLECQQADEALILGLMSSPERNRDRMIKFLQDVELGCVPASLDCVPENASVVTQHGTVQAQGLLTVDSQHWTPEVPERIGIYHAYIRGFNRDVRNHRLFIGCSGGMNRASDAFCNMVIDVGKSWTAQVGRGGQVSHLKTETCFFPRISVSRKRPGGCERAAGERGAG